MIGDVDVYDEHAEALMRFATVLVGASNADAVVSAAVRRTMARRPLTQFSNPRAVLMRDVFREAQSVVTPIDSVHLSAPHDVDREVAGAARHDAANDAVLRLSLRCRAVVYLVYAIRLTAFEAAFVMRIPAFVVRRYLRRAENQCRKLSPENNPWFRRRFRESLVSLVETAPRVTRFETIRASVMPGRTRRFISFTVGTGAVALGLIGVAGAVGSLLLPAQAPSVDLSTVPETAFEVPADRVRIVAPEPGPDPGPLAPCCAEQPFGVGFAVGRNDVTLALRNQLPEVIDQANIPGLDLSNVVLWPAAVIRDDLYTVVAREDVPVGVIRTTGGVFSGFGSDETLWLEVVTRKNWGWTKRSRVVWSAVPGDTAVVRATIPDGRVLLQRPIGQTAFFDLTTPGWDQIARFTALDANGNPLSARTLEIAGGGCSGRLAQVPFRDRTLPTDVGATRMSVLNAAIRCDAAMIEQVIRDRPGTAISLNAVDRSYGLARLDLVYPVMRDLGRVFLEPWTIEQGPTGDVYVWSLESNDDVLQVRVSLIP